MAMHHLRKGLIVLLRVFLDATVLTGTLLLVFFAAGNAASYNDNQIFAFTILTVSDITTTIGLFAIFHIYRLLSRNFGLHDAIVIGCVNLFVFLVTTFVFLLSPQGLFPTTNLANLFLGSVTALFLLCGWRATARVVHYWKKASDKKMKGGDSNIKRTAVIGAGDAAKLVVDESRHNSETESKVVLAIDDDPTKIGFTLSGVPVAGPIENVASLLSQYHIDQVVIAIQNLSKERLNEILGYLRDCDVQIKRLPVLSELGSVHETKILDVDIADILGRPQIILDNSEMKSMLHGKCVLVTGAGGSIGSELVRQIYAARPSTLILFDIYENAVYSIQQELVRRIKRENCADVRLVTLIGSTYNYVRMEQVFKEYHPDYIYHAAAYKHVPLMEESPVEAVRTNDLGTYNVAKLADIYGVKKMLFVSTDKAVRPTNAMGCTKRFAEMIIQYFASKSKSTKYCCVRFGNVLGSNGSVIPLFAKQIAEGGPITLTDKNIIRYFMTIPEAVSLVLQSSIFAEGGEIFILDMGKPVKIYDLAKKMIRQAGLVPDKDIKIVVTGLRPGEKLYEETLLDPSVQKKTANDRIFIEPAGDIQPIEEEIAALPKIFALETTPNEVKEYLKRVVDTYTPEMDD